VRLIKIFLSHCNELNFEQYLAQIGMAVRLVSPSIFLCIGCQCLKGSPKAAVKLLPCDNEVSVGGKVVYIRPKVVVTNTKTLDFQSCFKIMR
jgi:hypothetical protein